MKNLKISHRTIYFLLLVALAASLFPLFWVARYNVPSADDFSYGMETHFIWENGGSLWDVLKEAGNCVVGTWKGWQGSFAAIFLFCLQPAVFGEEYYALVPWIMIPTLLAGCFCFCMTLYHRVFHGSKIDAGILAVVLSVLCVQFLPRTAQSFYWFNGSVYYTFFFALSLFAYSLILLLLDEKREKIFIKEILASVLLFLIGGGNLITGLTTACLLCLCMLIVFLWRKPVMKRLIFPLLCFAVGFALNVSAPGNAARQRYFYPPTPTRALVLSFQEMALELKRWLCLPVIALLVFSLPFLRRIVSSNDYKFRYPGWVTLVSICLMAAMYYPCMYSMGHVYQVWRVLNIIYFGDMFILLFLLFYWLGWLLRKNPNLLATEEGKLSVWFILPVFAVFLYGTFFCSAYDVSAVSASQSYLSGQMGVYHHTYKQRLEVLKDPAIQDAVLKRYPVRPYVLWYIEYSLSPKGDPVVAGWYHKNSVVVR